MLQPQTLDELERHVAIAELRAITAEMACYPDEETATSAAVLARTIDQTLQAERPTQRSLAVPVLFSLKIRMSAVLDRMSRLRTTRDGDRR